MTFTPGVITSYSIHYTKLYEIDTRDIQVTVGLGACCIDNLVIIIPEVFDRDVLSQFNVAKETKTWLTRNPVKNLHNRLDLLVVRGNPSRITSYNVCYTKLLRV